MKSSAPQSNAPSKTQRLRRQILRPKIMSIGRLFEPSNGRLSVSSHGNFDYPRMLRQAQHERKSLNHLIVSHRIVAHELTRRFVGGLSQRARQKPFDSDITN